MICRALDTDIYYKSVGEGKPVLLLHGCAVDHRLIMGCMEPVFQKHGGYRRIYPDFPGMGRSPAPDWIKSSDNLLDVLTAFAAALIPQESFLVAGESYGGYLARALPERFPERVDGLMLICPVAEPNHALRTTPPHVALLRDEAYLATLSKAEGDALRDSLTVVDAGVCERFRRDVAPGLAAADQFFIDRLQKNYALSGENLALLETRFEKPALILTGRQDDTVGWQDQWRMMQQYPRCAYAVLDMAGHNLQVEQPVLFQSLAEDWLRRTELYKLYKY